MNIKKLGYWGTTGLVAFVLVASGIANIVQPEPVAEMMRNLGYPSYFFALIGTWKILGGVAIAAPGFPRLKEWAYAGIFFDFTGAFVSHVAVGDPVNNIATPAVLAVLLVVSYQLRSARTGTVGDSTVLQAQPAS